MYGRDLDRWFMSNIYGMVERYYLVMIDSFLYFFAQTQMPFENSCVLVYSYGGFDLRLIRSILNYMLLRSLWADS